MKKVLFAIFAHPDDEGFGPAGTLIKEAEAGTDVHLVTLTAGQEGANPDNHPNLAEVRLQEWRASGELIGATSMTHLGYEDGALSNTSLIEITEKLEQLVRQRIDDTIDEVEFMSFELGGISGHIDHIVAARAVCAVFYRMKPYDERFTRVRLFCLPESELPSPDVSWLFMDKGHPESEYECVDVSDLTDRRIGIIKAHHTQREDGEKHIERCHRAVSQGRCCDCFIVRT